MDEGDELHRVDVDEDEVRMSLVVLLLVGLVYVRLNFLQIALEYLIGDNFPVNYYQLILVKVHLYFYFFDLGAVIAVVLTVLLDFDPPWNSYYYYCYYYYFLMIDWIDQNSSFDYYPEENLAVLDIRYPYAEVAVDALFDRKEPYFLEAYCPYFHQVQGSSYYLIQPVMDNYYLDRVNPFDQNG